MDPIPHQLVASPGGYMVSFIPPTDFVHRIEIATKSLEVCPLAFANRVPLLDPKMDRNLGVLLLGV